MSERQGPRAAEHRAAYSLRRAGAATLALSAGAASGCRPRDCLGRCHRTVPSCRAALNEATSSPRNACNQYGASRCRHPPQTGWIGPSSVQERLPLTQPQVSITLPVPGVSSTSTSTSTSQSEEASSAVSSSRCHTPSSTGVGQP